MVCVGSLFSHNVHSSFYFFEKRAVAYILTTTLTVS